MILTGGARGVDTYVVELGKQKSMKVVIVPPVAYRDGNGMMSEIDVIMHYEGSIKVCDANKTLNRKTSVALMNSGLLHRNCHIVYGSNKIVALGHFEKHGQILQGGTGWTVQLAIDAKKPVSVYIDEEEKWYQYDYDSKQFKLSVFPILRKSEDTAIVGSRNITDNMKLELRRIFRLMSD